MEAAWAHLREGTARDGPPGALAAAGAGPASSGRVPHAHIPIMSGLAKPAVAVSPHFPSEEAVRVRLTPNPSLGGGPAPWAAVV